MRPLPKRASTKNVQEEKIVEINTGMDHAPVARKQSVRRFGPLVGLGLVALLAFPAYQVLTDTGTGQISSERVQSGEVMSSPFGEFVPVNARLVPDTTVFLDTVEGGRVIAVHAEEGETVLAGTPLVTLKNTDLELQVMAREAQYTEQLSNLARAEIDFDQNRLRYDRDLMDASLQIDLTRTALEQRLPIEQTGIAQAEIDRLQAELSHQQSSYDLISGAREKDQRNASRNLTQLRGSVDRMQDSLTLLRDTLGGLTLSAPMEGQVSALTIRIGEVVPAGGRLGQVDGMDGFKARAPIDEFYLGRVAVGQIGMAEIEGETVTLKITKIYPNISNRQFEIDLDFEGDVPTGLRRGQALRIRLELGNVVRTLTVPNGAWFEASGGLWAFVLAPDNRTATRREIRLGRRNPEQIEVLSGLSAGERILTSNYDGFDGKSRIRLTNQ